MRVTLLLLTLLISPLVSALEVEGVFRCDSTSQWVALSDGCPDEVEVSIGGNVGGTSADATVTVSGLGANLTVHVCADDESFCADGSRNCSDSTVDPDRETACLDNVGMVSKNTLAFTEDGTDTVTLSGFTAGTEGLYTIAVPVPSAGDYPNRPVRGSGTFPSFNTVASGGSGLETENARFVGTGGNDSNDGMTHATRWATVAKVNSETLPIGTDVYFLDDDTYDDATLVVDWDGNSSDDSVIIQTYYLDGGTVPTAHDSSDVDAGAYAILGDVQVSAGLDDVFLYDVVPASLSGPIKPWISEGTGMAIKFALSQNSEYSSRQPIYDAEADKSHIEVITVYRFMSELYCSNTDGDYGNTSDTSCGIGHLKAEIDYVWDGGAGAMINLVIVDQTDPNDTTDASNRLPNFLDGINCTATTTNRVVFRQWSSSCEDIMNDLITDYAAVFDGYPGLFSVSINREGVTGPVDGGQSYSGAGWVAAMESRLAHCVSEFSSTHCMYALNGLNAGVSQATLDGMFDTARDLGAGVMHPDTAPDCIESTGTNACNTGDSFVATASQGIKAYRSSGDNSYEGDMLLFCLVETSELGNRTVGDSKGYDLERISTYATDNLGCNVITMARRDFCQTSAGNQHRWNSTTPSSCPVEGGYAIDEIEPYLSTFTMPSGNLAKPTNITNVWIND